MSKDINVTDGTVLETLNNKVDLDGGNYIGSPLEEYIHEHCGGDKLPLGHHFYQDGAQPSLSYMKSEGQYNSGKTYETFYNEFVQKIGQAFAGGFVREITDEYTDYDLVINQDDMTFRLPLLDGSEDLPSDKIEDLPIVDNQGYEAEYNGKIYLQGWGTAVNGWANITIYDKDNRVIAGYNTFSPIAGHGVMQTISIRKGQFWRLNYLNFDIRELHFIYAQGNGSLYFKVDNAVTNLELLNVGEVMEAVNNVIPDNSSLIASYAMPSSRYIDLTLGASGATYTAPANGWFQLTKRTASTNQWVSLWNTTVGGFGMRTSPNESGANVGCFVPVKKGDVCTITYNATGELDRFRFLYAEGDQ